MIVLSAQHIAKAFGGTDILLDASLTLQSRERIGLVGVNGCGKSTFLKILTDNITSRWQKERWAAMLFSPATRKDAKRLQLTLTNRSLWRITANM